MDLVVVEVEAGYLIVVAAAFDGGPIYDGVGGGRGVAEVGLFEDFGEAGAGAAVGEELAGLEVGAFGAVDDVEEAEFEGVGHGDAEIQIPGTGICISCICEFRISNFDWGMVSGRWSAFV